MLNPLKIISKFIKSSNQKNLDNLKSVVKKVNELENTLSELKDDEFPKKTELLKERVKNGESLKSLLPDAYALVREASKRTRGERHFDVQIMGGIVLHNGNIAEMKTGEGKTLTIVLAAYLNALNGDGVHIVTVNDYLAKRDCLEMGVIYKFLGLTSGFINNDQNDEERKKNYNCDITYATNSELGFDYLRDNMKFSKREFVQRGHKFAIVDEIDSCLIDEARTPLVISGAAENKGGQYLAIDKLVKKLNEKDYELDEKDKNIYLTNIGISNVEKIFDQAGLLKNNNLYDPNNLSLVHFVNQALRANHLFTKGKDYENILNQFPTNVSFYFCKLKSNRSQNMKKVFNYAYKKKFDCKYFNSVDLAYENAYNDSKKTDLIFVGGSTFTISEFPRFNY